jgi:hypothetical protein
MLQLVAGAAVFVVTGVVFWMCLPRGGKTHRLVDTEWEPYVGVAFCSAIALALTMLLSGALDLGLFGQLADYLRQVMGPAVT